MPVRWQPDPSQPAGGYFLDSTTGKPIGNYAVPPPDLGPNPQWDTAAGRFISADQAANRDPGTLGPPAARPAKSLAEEFEEFLKNRARAPEVNPAATPMRPTPAASSATPAVTGEDPVAQMIAAFAARNGAVQGQPYNTNPRIQVPGGTDRETQDNPNPTMRYTFANGSTLEITKDGQVVKSNDLAQQRINDTATPGGQLAEQGVYIIGGRAFRIDPNNPKGDLIPVSPGDGKDVSNPDEDISKAIKAQNEGRDRDARVRNQATMGYDVTDVQRSVIEEAARRNGWNEQQVANQLIRIQNQNKNDDIAAANQTLKTTADVGQIGAMTDKVRAEIVALGLTTPAQVTQALASGSLSQASADKIRAEMARMDRPVTGTADTTAPYTVRIDPTNGKPIYDPNINYLGKDTGAQVASLSQQAQLKRDQLDQLVQQGKLDGATAAQQFNSWWDATVEPRKAQIAEAQQQQRLDNQIKIATEQRQQQTTAQGMGQQAIDAYIASAKNMVGPGHAAAVQTILDSYSSGKAPGKIDAASLTWQGPSLQDLASQATEKAMAGFQKSTPLQVPEGVDVASALDRTKYIFGGAPAGAQARVPVAAGGAPPPPPPQPTFWEQMRLRANTGPIAPTMSTQQVFGAPEDAEISFDPFQQYAYRR